MSAPVYGDGAPPGVAEAALRKALEGDRDPTDADRLRARLLTFGLRATDKALTLLDSGSPGAAYDAAQLVTAASAALTAARGATPEAVAVEPWVVVDVSPSCDPAEAFYGVRGWSRSLAGIVKMTEESARELAWHMTSPACEAVAVPLSRAASVARGGK